MQQFVFIVVILLLHKYDVTAQPSFHALNCDSSMLDADHAYAVENGNLLDNLPVSNGVVELYQSRSGNPTWVYIQANFNVITTGNEITTATPTTTASPTTVSGTTVSGTTASPTTTRPTTTSPTTTASPTTTGIVGTLDTIPDAQRYLFAINFSIDNRTICKLIHLNNF